jgi:hypothetical protein
MKRVTLILAILVFTCSVYAQNTSQPKPGNKPGNDNKSKEDKHHHPHHHDPKPGEKK